MQPWFVYILRCGDGSFYIGATNDVEARVVVHNSGRGGAYTASHLPINLLYSERCGSRSSALKREAAMKRWTRRQKQQFLSEKGVVY